MANTTIQIKKSSVPGNKPLSLANGELAINFADGKLFYNNTTNQIAEFAPASGGSYFGTVNAAGTFLVADIANDILTIDAGTNITITPDAANDRMVISSAGGSDPNAALAFNKANAANVLAFNALPNTSGVSFNGSLVFPRGNVDISAGRLFTIAPAGLTPFGAYGAGGAITWDFNGSSASYLDSNTIYFRSGNPSTTERMRIDPSGNIVIRGSDSSAQLSLGVWQSDAYIGTNTADALYIRTSNTNRIRIGSSGGVDMYGTLYVYDIVEVQRSNNNADFYFNSVGGLGRRWLMTSGTNGAWTLYDSTGSNTRVNISGASGTFRMFTANANTTHTFDYSNLGGRLTLNDDSGGSATRLEEQTNATRLLQLIDGSDMYIGFGSSTVATGNLMFMRPGYNEAVRIDATGRVLVGTSSARSNFLNASLASAGLQIEGIAATNSSMSFIRDGASSNPPRMFLAKSRGATVGSNALVQSGDILGSISFEGNDGAEFVEGAKIDSVVDGTAAADTMPSRLEFHTSNTSSPIERMRIDSSGNVSIGTILNPEKLTANGGIAAIGQLSGGKWTANGAYLGLETTYGCLELVGDSGGVIDFSRINEDHSGRIIYDRTANTMAFSTGAVQRMVIGASGNVGIGTTSPTSGRSLTLNDAANYYGIDFQTSGTTQGKIIQESTGNMYYDASSQIIFRTNPANERMRIASDGTVSIGTTATGSYLLDVNGTGRYQGRLNAWAAQSVGSMLTATGSLGGIEVYGGGSANAAFMCFHRPGAYASYFGLDNDNNFAVGGWSAGAALGLMKVGSFGVGTAASGTAGEIRATNNITAYYSDKRLKKNIQIIDHALDKVKRISGVTFQSNDEAAKYGYTNANTQVGVIAQEIEAVLPEVVVPAPFDIGQDENGFEYSLSGQNYKTVQYDKLVPLLIEAIKEMSYKIDTLQNRIEELEKV